MKPQLHPTVRKHLRANNGQTVGQIAQALGLCTKSVRRVLEGMPDAFIDRWTDPKRGQWQAVWCVVEVPPHCPYPTERFVPETRWIASSYTPWRIQHAA